MGTPNEFERIAREALSCRECFRLREVAAPPFDIAQPRWVGPHYWNTSPRVAILMINPGKGSATAEILTLYRDARDGRCGIDEVLEHERQSMPEWGRPRGRFTAFYLDGIGLALDEIAFANIAWCATEKNRYPSSVLNRCFERHTKVLLKLLSPDILLVSGVRARVYRQKIQRVLPRSRIEPISHYAHRKGCHFSNTELGRVREVLDAWRKDG